VAESASGGSLVSGGRFCVGAFGRNLASVALKISHLIYFKIHFFKSCTFNKIYKGNAAINCVAVQHKTGLFPSTLTLV
jgi:hypothetical protein